MDRDLATEAAYIENVSGFPVWDGTQGEYFPIGEAFFESLKEELQKAQKFIFMEYFIIQEGQMWDPGDSQEKGGFRCGSPAALR